MRIHTHIHYNIGSKIIFKNKTFFKKSLFFKIVLRGSLICNHPISGFVKGHVQENQPAPRSVKLKHTDNL